MSTFLTFRPAGPADADAVAALHADSWRRHYRGAYADAYLDGDLLTERRAVWSARLSTPSSTETILAEQDGALAGFVHIVFDDHLRWGSLVDNLHVAHHRHRGGIGTRLLSAAARAAQRRATSRGVYLWVLEQNTTAQAFYRASGGTAVETGVAAAPCGDPELLNGRPAKFRMAWPDAALLAGVSRTEHRPSRAPGSPSRHDGRSR
jgi:ribosomal protein S18 acetylase RimI-like enzyme